jgi:cob(I)alamin adenosyltransferase
MAGEILVVTGNGKGKTTYALSLCIKAAGAGKKVFLGQFIKGSEYSEIKALKKLDDLIVVEQFGLGRFIEGVPHPEDRTHAQKGFERVAAVLKTNAFDLVVLDEANVALKYNLFPLSDFLAAIRNRAAGVSVVVTGRDAHPDMVELADDVIEMKEIKHYYRAGVPARVGIEK